MSQVSEFTIGKLNSILEKVQKDLELYTVGVSLYGKRMYVTLKPHKMDNDIDEMIKIRDKVIEYFGIDKNSIKTAFAGTKRVPSLEIGIESQELYITIEQAM
jgi:hypothetical protein